MQTKKLQRNSACVLLTLGSLLTAHTQAQAQDAAAKPAPGMVRICDDRGCADRPVDSATFDTPANAPQAPSARLQALINKAEQDPRAAYDLGLRYFRGDGVGRDSYKAIEWMRSAGDRGLRDGARGIRQEEGGGGQGEQADRPGECVVGRRDCCRGDGHGDGPCAAHELRSPRSVVRQDLARAHE